MNFNERVWNLCKKVPKGRVTTYKAIAEALNTRAYRAVGNAMNRNPYGIIRCSSKDMVPCHRVVDSRGHLHGFAHGLKKKAMLLRKEGIRIENKAVKNFEKVMHAFPERKQKKSRT